MPRRIRLIIEYDGTHYVGWQNQPNGVSIQSMIEAELQKITGEKISLHASGRTDSGVHALAQVAHFDTNVRMPADKFSFALNTGLPRDIRVRYSDEAPEGFHSRFDALKKHYRYRVQPGPHARVFCRDTALHTHGNLDLELMNTAAEFVIGEHDFRAFMATRSPFENTVRTIYRSEWTRYGDMLRYDVVGNGFLYNMVRILAGTMIDIGKGNLEVKDMQRALKSGDRSHAGATAPPHGLTLVRVIYPDFDTADILMGSE